MIQLTRNFKEIQRSSSSSLWSQSDTTATVEDISAAGVNGARNDSSSINQKCLKLSRTLSFASGNMATIPFPEKSAVEHLMINIVFYVKILPSDMAIKCLVKDKLLKFLRFRSIPVQGRWFSFWKEVDVSVDDHIYHHTAPNAAAIHSTLESIMQIGYKADKPRWEIRVIKDLQTDDLEKHPDARNVIVIRVDHSISDGISLAKTCYHFLTNKKGEAFPENTSFGLVREKFPFVGSGQFSKAFPSCSFLNKVFSLGYLFINTLMNILSLFKAIFLTFYEVCGPFDSDSPLTRPKSIKKQLGVHRPTTIKFVKSLPISLSYVKQLKSKAHVPLNDILLSAFAGTIRRYCENLNFPIDNDDGGLPVQIRAILPYAFISPPEEYEDTEKALRNRWVAVSIRLPVDKKDPLDRLMETFRITQAMKQRKQPLVNYYVHNFLCRWILPKRVVKLAGDFLFNKHSVVFATVPTTKEECCFAGVLVEEFQVLFISVIPQVEIISYADKVFFSLVFDADVIQNGNLISQYFVEELNELGCRLQIPGSILHGELQ